MTYTDNNLSNPQIQSKKDHPNTRHGYSRRSGRTPEYGAWRSMKARCYNKNDIFYHRYGARGIKVCDHWLEDFQNFINDVGGKPTSKHSLDRIDNNGNYEPGNVRWADPKIQGRNRCDNKLIEYQGEAAPIAEWADRFNLNYETLRGRLQRKWSIEDCLNKPIRKIKGVHYDK